MITVKVDLHVLGALADEYGIELAVKANPNKDWRERRYRLYIIVPFGKGKAEFWASSATAALTHPPMVPAEEYRNLVK